MVINTEEEAGNVTAVLSCVGLLQMPHLTACFVAVGVSGQGYSSSHGVLWSHTQVTLHFL